MMTASNRFYRYSLKLVTSALCIGIGVVLIGYAVITNRIAAEDFAFLQQHRGSRLFPTALYLQGGYAFYGLLDPALAADYYARALVRNPVYIPAWLGLARAELAQADVNGARRLFEILQPLLARVSTWKWQELLLAYDLRDSERFAGHLNFILSRLPYRIPEAVYLAQKYYGDAGAAAAHIAAENRARYLDALLRMHRTEAVVAFWEQIRQQAPPIDEKTRLRLCHYLLANRQPAAAEAIWRDWLQGAPTGIHDGGFEQEPLNQAFGWSFRHHPQVVVERTATTARQGGKSLHLHFRGSDNVDFQHVSQIFPVQPGGSYTLRFVRKSSNLTTDQGVFLEVVGYQCEGLSVRSGPVTGSSPWLEEELSFSVPDGCRAAHVSVRRRQSLMFDNKIAGDYWLDAVRLEQRPAA